MISTPTTLELDVRVSVSRPKVSVSVPVQLKPEEEVTNCAWIAVEYLLSQMCRGFLTQSAAAATSMGDSVSVVYGITARKNWRQKEQAANSGINLQTFCLIERPDISTGLIKVS